MTRSSGGIVSRLFDFRLWFIPPSIVLVCCLLLIQIETSEAKSRVEKVEKFREWAQEKLAQVADELSQKGIEPSSYYRKGENGGKLQVFRAEKEGEEGEVPSVFGGPGGEEGGRRKNKVEAELQYWAKKRTSLRRHKLQEKSGSLGIDAQPALSDLETGSATRSEPTMIELPLDEEAAGETEAEGGYLEETETLHNDTAKDNAMLGEEDEPFHIPHHETEAVNTPKARPVLRGRKQRREGEEGRLAHAIRDIVEPVLPKDGGVTDKHRSR